MSLLMQAEASENNQDYAYEADLADEDYFSVKLEELLESSDEDSDPSHSHSPSIADGLLQGTLNPGNVSLGDASQPHDGIPEFAAAAPMETRKSSSTEWTPSNYSEVSGSEQGTGLGSSFDFFGSFSNFNDTHTPMFDDEKLYNLQLTENECFNCQPTSVAPDWLGLSSSQLETCNSGSFGGSVYPMVTKNPDYQVLQYEVPKCSSTSEISAVGPKQYSLCISSAGVNLTMSPEFQNNGTRKYFLYPNITHTGGMSDAELRMPNICTSPSSESSIDPDASTSNIPHLEVNTGKVIDSMWHASNSYRACGNVDNGHFTESTLRQCLPVPYDQSFLSSDNEAMNGIKDEAEYQDCASQSLWTNPEVKLGIEEETLVTSLADVPILDLDASLPEISYAKLNHPQNMNIKYAYSTDSLSATKQVASGGNCVPVSDALKQALHIEEVARVKKVKVCLKDERKGKLPTSHDEQYHFVKIIDEDIQKDLPMGSINMDDDSDICILDDISDPCRPPLPVVHVKSHSLVQRSGFSDSHLSGIRTVRFKEDDERLTYHTVLKDLSQPKSEASPPEGVLAVPLLKHQRIALSWMVQKETASLHCSGGILADDQGLGKTISTIALILMERSISSMGSKQGEFEALNLDEDDEIVEPNGVKQPLNSGHVPIGRPLKSDNAFVAVKGRPAAGTLVVCPTSVLRQWAEELQNKVTREANLSFLIYHGSNRTKDPMELAKYDVVLTTYSIVSLEVPKQPLVDKNEEEKGKPNATGLYAGSSTSRKRKNPSNSNQKDSRARNSTENAMIDSSARPLARVGWFRVILDEAQSIKNHRTQVARACWGLRAKRRWCLSGTPIQNAVDDLYSYFRFLRYDPYAVYKSFCSTIKVPINRNPVSGYKKLQAVLKTIMLRRTKGTMINGEPIITLPPKSVTLKKVDFSKEERDFYSRLENESREQFKVYAEAGTVQQNYVNILLMLLRLRQACDHPLLVKGYDSSSVWRSSMEMAKKLSRDKQIFLLNCLEACFAICAICNDPPEDAVVTVCGHVFCNQCICEHLTGDDNHCPSDHCKIQLSVASVFSQTTLRSSLSSLTGHDSSPCGSCPELVETPEPGEEGLSTDSSKIKAAVDILQLLPKSHESPSNSNPMKSDVERTSSPQNACDAASIPCPLLCPKSIHDRCFDTKKYSTTQATEKAIVFSQWTRMLDLLEVRLKKCFIQFRRLDGTMTVAARDKAVKDFNTLPEITVMIMSLKAASLGLNMVAACHVILLDLWWNPTTEDQAIDRAHRIGQTRPVTVFRLTVNDTVEDRILALQEKKREMVASAFGEDETGGRQTRLTLQDLKYLFNFMP